MSESEKTVFREQSLLPQADRYGTVQVSCPLESGLYAVTFSQKTAAPFALRMQGA